MRLMPLARAQRDDLPTEGSVSQRLDDYEGCPNRRPGCGESAPGYNPLRLCVACLTKYKGAGGHSRPIGEGASAKLTKPAPCPSGCPSSAPCPRSRVTRSGGWIHYTPPVGGCGGKLS
jgi:hypothetical protein